MYDIVWQIYHTWCFHCCMYQIFGRRYQKYPCHVVWAGDLIHWCFWNNQPSYMIIKMGPLTTYQHSATFSCDRKGSQLLFHVTSPNMYANHWKTKKWHVPKIILNRDIAIWSFRSVLIWKKNLHFILLLIANNVIYVKFLFFGSIVPHKLIWDSLYCRGMICYLHFRRHIRFTNITAIHMSCIVLLFITMIFVALTNRYMWKVHNFGRLEISDFE